jgi:RNA polymerase sigma factor (sigma-70 family)
MKAEWNEFINGNNRALALVYEDLFQPLLFISIKQTQNPELSRDIVSDLFLNLLDVPKDERKNKWQEVREIRAFLTVVIRNKSIDALRTKINRTKIETSLISVQNDFIEDEYSNEDHYEKSISYLNSAEKELIELHFQGFSNTEIADKLNYSDKTVRNKLSLSKKKLKYFWENLILIISWNILN